MQNPLSPLSPKNILNSIFGIQEEAIVRRRKAIRSLKARADAKRTFAEKVADTLTSKFGSITFLTMNFIWFAVWIPVNMGLVPGVEPFDPFPFGLLTMIVSLEAIGLAIIVLISQNREAKISELREEIDLQINTVADAELTKILHLLGIIMEKQGIDISSPEIKRLLKPIDSTDLVAELEQELNPKSNNKIA